jgi:hypothetical protein
LNIGVKSISALSTPSNKAFCGETIFGVTLNVSTAHGGEERSDKETQGGAKQAELTVSLEDWVALSNLKPELI